MSQYKLVSTKTNLSHSWPRIDPELLYPVKHCLPGNYGALWRFTVQPADAMLDKPDNVPPYLPRFESLVGVETSVRPATTWIPQKLCLLDMRQRC